MYSEFTLLFGDIVDQFTEPGNTDYAAVDAVRGYPGFSGLDRQSRLGRSLMQCLRYSISDSLFEDAVRASGLPRIRLHDLRRTHATIALGADIHPKVVSDRLGHSTVAFTLDVYSHCVHAPAQDVAEKIAALVSVAR
jgi:integrase